MKAQWLLLATVSAAGFVALSGFAPNAQALGPKRCTDLDLCGPDSPGGGHRRPPPPPHTTYEGMLVKGSGDPIYLVRGQQRHWIPDMMTFEAMGFLTVSVTLLPAATINGIALGDPVPHKDLADGSIVKSPSTGKVYMLSGARLHSVPLPATLQSRKLATSAITVRDSTLNALTTADDVPFVPATFTVSIDMIQINALRAHSSDTDVVYINARVDNTWMSPTIVHLGDLGGGQHPTSVQLDNITVRSADTQVLIDYAVYNGGSVTNDILQKAAESVSGYAPAVAQGPTWLKPGDWLFPPSQQGSGSNVQGTDPFWKSTARNLTNVLGGYLWGRLFTSCDGSVAWAQKPMTGSKMLELTSQNAPPALQSVSITENFPGIDSPMGCGGNSNYDVTWSLALK